VGRAFVLSASRCDLLVPRLACIMKAVFLDVLLYVCRATGRSTLGAAVGGLVRVDALVSPEATLVRQQHRAHLAYLPQKERYV